MTPEQEDKFKRLLEAHSRAMLDLHKLSIDGHSRNLIVTKCMAATLEKISAINAELGAIQLPSGDSADKLKKAIAMVEKEIMSKLAQTVRDVNSRAESFIERYELQMVEYRRMLLPPD